MLTALIELLTVLLKYIDTIIQTVGGWTLKRTAAVPSLAVPLAGNIHNRKLSCTYHQWPMLVDLTPN